MTFFPALGSHCPFDITPRLPIVERFLQFGSLLEINPYFKVCQGPPDDLFSVVTREPQEAVIDIKNLPVRQRAGNNRDRAVAHELGEHGVVGLEWAHLIHCGIHLTLKFHAIRVLDMPVPQRCSEEPEPARGVHALLQRDRTNVSGLSWQGRGLPVESGTAYDALSPQLPARLSRTTMSVRIAEI